MIRNIKNFKRHMDGATRALVNRIVELHEREKTQGFTERDREELNFLFVVLKPAFDKVSEDWNRIIQWIKDQS